LTLPQANSEELMGDFELSATDFQALYERLRGHAQWGNDDRRGALNHITPARLLAAASEVQTGRSVTLAAPLAGSAADNPESGARNMKPVRHRTAPVAWGDRLTGQPDCRTVRLRPRTRGIAQ
jgi:hypothetical protein